jgi:hypothetical protein
MSKKAVVKDLQVTVTYKVGLGNVEMPKKAKEEIIDAAAKCKDIEMSSNTYPFSAEWLMNNIKERDAFSWSVQIDDVS